MLFSQAHPRPLLTALLAHLRPKLGTPENDIQASPAPVPFFSTLSFEHALFYIKTWSTSRLLLRRWPWKDTVSISISGSTDVDTWILNPGWLIEIQNLLTLHGISCMRRLCTRKSVFSRIMLLLLSRRVPGTLLGIWDVRFCRFYRTIDMQENMSQIVFKTSNIRKLKPSSSCFWSDTQNVCICLH